MRSLLPRSVFPLFVLAGAALAWPIGVSAGTPATNKGRIVVHIVDESGAPQPGATVRLFIYDDGSRHLTDQHLDQRCDATGTTRFDRIELGKPFVLRAEAIRGLVGYQGWTLSPRMPTKEFKIVVVPVAAARIHTDERRRPISGATIACIRLGGRPTVQRFPQGAELSAADLGVCESPVSPSDVHGDIALPALPRGIARLELFHPNYAPTSVDQFEIKRGAVADVVMPSGVKIKFAFQLPSGVPTPNHLVLTLQSEKLGYQPYLSCELPPLRADHTIELTLAPGKYQYMAIRYRDYLVTPDYDSPFELTAEVKRFDFRVLKKQRIHGRVVEDSSGKPIANCYVSAEADSGKLHGPLAKSAAKWAFADGQTTDEQGRFDLDAAAGTVRLSPSCDGTTPIHEHEIVQFAADGSTAIPDIRMRATPTVRGIVLDRDGKPAVQAIVRFRNSDLAFDYPVVTDERGRFKLLPSKLPCDLRSGKPISKQTILAFDPYRPLGAVGQVDFSDPKSLTNVVLRLAPQDFSFPVYGFPDEGPGLMREWPAKRKTEAARMSRGGMVAPELAGTWINLAKSAGSPPNSLASLRGKFVLLKFFTVSCGPCQIDEPQLELAYKLYKDRGLAVVCVHPNFLLPSELQQFAAERKMQFPILVDDADGHTMEAYKPHGAFVYPSYMLVEPDGTLLGDPTGTSWGMWLFKIEILRQQLMSR